ncbi:MAG: hypothetical protein V1936_01560 [Patescibacteria group bacterium]
MNARKILTILVGAIIALGGLAFTISLLSNAVPARSSTETVFVSSASNETKVAKAGSAIAEKGSLQLGKFAVFQLTNDATALEFVSANFDEKTEALSSARGRVNSGSVLAVNLLFGNEFTLLDDRVAATNHGGSFVFEKDAEKNSTLVRVLSGSAELAFSNATDGETFSAVLLAGEEVNLDDAAIAGIFAIKDGLARTEAWREKIGRFTSKFEGESRLVGKILEELPDGKSNGLIDLIKESLLFNPTKKEDFYSGQLAGFLAAAANGDASAIGDLLATSNATKRATLQTVVARALPFTRLFMSEALSPALKEKIVRLAELATPLANFAESANLTATDDLNRNLLFIADDPTNTKLTQNFLERAKNGITETDAASVAWLLRILERDAKSTNSDWLDAWSAVNRARIVDNFDLAEAITDQLELADALVKAGREQLASNTLKDLAGLLNRGSQGFDQASLEKIAAAGNELRNRVLFLASLRGEGEFEEKAYQAWLLEQAKTGEENPTEEKPAEEQPSSQPDNPNRIARPESELTKFLKMGDLPTSDTQIEEEKKLEEDSKNKDAAAEKSEPSPTEQTEPAAKATEPTPTTESPEKPAAETPPVE